MQGLVYHGPGQKSWERVAEPKVEESTDIIVRNDTTTICGTDLHILKGDVPAVEAGRVLGHESIGTIEETGSAVTELQVGDRVLVPAVTSCGKCSYCKRGVPSHCLAVGGIGWIFGHLIDGTQAEYTRVPFAETSVHRVPDGVSDEQMLFLSDIVPTGFEVGVRNGQVQPGDAIAVVGAGPVGLAAIMTAGLAGASRVIAVDLSASRREKAMQLGADFTIDGGSETVDEQVRSLTDGLGVDVAIEAVGVAETFETCTRIVRPGGSVANVGVHGGPATLHLEELWIKNITVTTGLVDATTVPMLLQLVRTGRISPQRLATHHFALGDIVAAYDVFAEADKNEAIKVVLNA